jgi:hypothetical protein
VIGVCSAAEHLGPVVQLQKDGDIDVRLGDALQVT